MSILTQFYLLQYKNWKLQFRSKISTVLEILIPVALCLLMVSIRTLVDVNEFPNATRYDAFDVNGVPNGLREKLTLPNTTMWGTGIAYTPKTPTTDRIMQNVKASIVAGSASPPPIIFQGMFRILLMVLEASIIL